MERLRSLERTDQELRDLNTRFKNGLKVHQRRTKRKWMELNALANRHALLLLPYQAMLDHIGMLVAERRQLFPLTLPVPPGTENGLHKSDFSMNDNGTLKDLLDDDFIQTGNDQDEFSDDPETGTDVGEEHYLTLPSISSKPPEVNRATP